MKLNWFRRAVAFKTTQSWRTVPHVSYIYEVDVSQSKRPDGISFNTFVLHVIAKAVRSAPRVNAHIRYNRLFATGRVCVKDKINIAMPCLLPNGEMRTVALMDVGGKSMAQLQQHIGEARMKAGKNLDIKTLDVIRWARESKQCTITVSNTGSLCKDLNGTLAMLEIIPPQIVAIGVGAIQNGRLPLCVAFDHRALNFSDILPFLRAIQSGFRS